MIHSAKAPDNLVLHEGAGDLLQRPTLFIENGRAGRRADSKRIELERDHCLASRPIGRRWRSGSPKAGSLSGRRASRTSISSVGAGRSFADCGHFRRLPIHSLSVSALSNSRQPTGNAI